MKRWLVVNLIIQAVDCLTSYIGGIEMEVFPTTVWVWETFGFGFLVLAKLLIPVLVVSVEVLAETPTEKQVCHGAMLLGTWWMVYICVNNVVALTC